MSRRFGRIDHEHALPSLALHDRIAGDDDRVLLRRKFELNPDKHAGLQLQIRIRDFKLDLRLPGIVLKQLGNAGDLAF